MAPKWPFSHLCWQLSHLGRGEAALSTQNGGQGALAHLFALSVAGLPSSPGETGSLAEMSSSGVRPGIHLWLSLSLSRWPHPAWVPLYEGEDNFRSTHLAGLL